MSTTSDLNLIHRTLFLDTCTPMHTGTLSMLDASAPIGATQDFDCVDYYGLAMSNELAYMPTTPVPSTPWFAVGEQLEAPIQGQDLNIHDINMMTRDDIDEVRAVLPPQAAEPVAAQGIDGAPSDMSTSTDDGTNSDGFGSPSSKKHGREDEQSGSPRQKKSRVEQSRSPQQKKSRKGGRTTRSASSRSQSSDDEQEKEKKPEFTCGAGGVVHVPMKIPTKNLSLFYKFLARDWQGFRDEAFALARINRKTAVREADKSLVHHMLDKFVELAKPCPQGSEDGYNFHTRKFLAIALEFFESIGDAAKLKAFCEGTAHLICLVCPTKSFNLHSNPNGYVAGDGSVTKHPHCHKNGIHALAYAMIMADLVKINVVV